MNDRRSMDPKPIELEPGEGVLWQSKSDHPKAPAYSGLIEIPRNLTGRAEIALWRYESKGGKPYLRVLVQPPYKKTGDPGARGQERRSRDDDGARAYRDRDRISERAPQRRQDPPPDEGFDDEIPF